MISDMSEIASDSTTARAGRDDVPRGIIGAISPQRSGHCVREPLPSAYIPTQLPDPHAITLANEFCRWLAGGCVAMLEKRAVGPLGILDWAANEIFVFAPENMDVILLALRLSGAVLIHQAGLSKIQNPAALVGVVGSLGFPAVIPPIAL